MLSKTKVVKFFLIYSPHHYNMTLEIFLRYLHFVSIFMIVGSLTTEFFLIRKEMLRADISRLARVDALYGMAALLLIGAGLTLWLSGAGKPSEYYTKNWIFHLKLTCFALVGVFSIYPTIFFIRQRRGNQSDVVAIPALVITFIRLELLLLAVIPLLAGLMARGNGFFG
jgi:putative membrane protein